MDFKEFKEKYFGKSVEEIKEGLKNEKNFWKSDIDLIKLTIDAEILVESILELDKDFASLYLFKKQYSIMLYILKELTNLEMIPEDEHFEDYNAFVEKAIVESNSNAYFFKNMVNDVIKQKQQDIFDKLYIIFNEGLPTKEDIKEMKQELDSMFSDESPEKLKTIESILAYNDPNIKQMKDFIFDTRIDIKDKEPIKEQNPKLDNISKEQKEAIEILQDTKNTTDNMVNLITSTPMVKEVDEKIKNEQMERVLEYNKELEQQLNKNN